MKFFHLNIISLVLGEDILLYFNKLIYMPYMFIVCNLKHSVVALKDRTPQDFTKKQNWGKLNKTLTCPALAVKGLHIFIPAQHFHVPLR